MEQDIDDGRPFPSGASDKVGVAGAALGECVCRRPPGTTTGRPAFHTYWGATGVDALQYRPVGPGQSR